MEQTKKTEQQRCRRAIEKEVKGIFKRSINAQITKRVKVEVKNEVKEQVKKVTNEVQTRFADETHDRNEEVKASPGWNKSCHDKFAQLNKTVSDHILKISDLESKVSRIPIDLEMLEASVKEIGATVKILEELVNREKPQQQPPPAKRRRYFVEESTSDEFFHSPLSSRTRPPPTLTRRPPTPMPILSRSRSRYVPRQHYLKDDDPYIEVENGHVIQSYTNTSTRKYYLR